MFAYLPAKKIWVSSLHTKVSFSNEVIYKKEEEMETQNDN